MLSRVALRSGAGRQSTLGAVMVRGSASDVSGVRDDKNFPRPVRGEPGKVRMGFIPEEWHRQITLALSEPVEGIRRMLITWVVSPPPARSALELRADTYTSMVRFQLFHSKTGVTGPYTFGVGLATYMCSKEIFVMEHEYYTGLSLLIMVWVASVKFGPQLAKWLDKEVDNVEANWNEGRKQTLASLEQAIKDEKESQWRAEGQELLMQAKKENVLLQLEGAYRERVMMAYNEVKRRLDYQLEKTVLERRLAQKHMVDWIVNNVTKAITPKQEKQNMDRCIADLAALAAARK